MEKFDKYLTRFNAEEKQKLASFYDEIPSFFGDKINEYFDFEYGYDTWFLTNVIIPEREKLLAKKIRNLAQYKAPISQDITNKLSPSTLSKLSLFNLESDQRKSNTISFVINALYTELTFDSDIEAVSQEAVNIDKFVNALLDNEAELSKHLAKYNRLMFEETQSYMDVFPDVKEIVNFLEATKKTVESLSFKYEHFQTPFFNFTN